MKAQKFGEKARGKGRRNREKVRARAAFGKFMEKERLMRAADLIPVAKNSTGFMKYALIVR